MYEELQCDSREIFITLIVSPLQCLEKKYGLFSIHCKGETMRDSTDKDATGAPDCKTACKN